MTPEDYIEIRDNQDAIIEKAEKIKYDAILEAAACPAPFDLRPATPDDIKLNNVIWSFNEDGAYWHIVEEIHNPSDSFKGYSFEGCRYGLDGAFVEDKE